MLVVGTTGGAAFLLRKSDFLRSRAGNTFDTQNIRIDLWKAALQQWKLHPIFGTGSGTYLYYGRQFRSEQVQLDPVRVHNDYLQLLAEYGLVGAAGFFLFLAAHLRSGWKNLQRLAVQQGAIPSLVSSNRLALQIGALCALAAYMVHSIFDFNLHIPANVLLLAFVFGILATRELRGEWDNASARFSRLFCGVTMAAMSVVILIAAARFVPGEYFAHRAEMALRDYQGREAVAFANRGLASERGNPDLYYYLGRGKAVEAEAMMDRKAQAQTYEEAIAAFKKGRALAPMDKTFAVELGLTYDELGRYSEGERVFEQALKLDPKSTSTRGYYQAHLKRWKEGRSAQEVHQ